ncbi:Mobile element protein [Candidatus Enterovibrio escicola]|uniref:Mobile element protein n=1 Tax=Candidatus Enterovibrio escicola TaxID=1927127 RepID=A0A2A5T379_9GAMM|nr:Mobile element protein [Candidatus Enterovibrio escacola]
MVFVTKYKRKVFNDDILNQLKIILEETCQDFEVNLTEFNGEKDHVHLLVEYPPKVQLSKLINLLKGVSSRLMRKEYPKIYRYLWKGALLSPSYFSGSCLEVNLEILTKYIEQQNRPE